MATREEVIAVLKSKGYNGPIPGESQAQGIQPNSAPQPQQNDVASLLQQAQGRGSGTRNYISDILTAGTTGKVPERQTDTMMNKYLETVLGEQAKSLYRDPLEDEKTRAQINKDNAVAESWKNFQGGGGMPTSEQTAETLGVDPDDIVTTPEMRTFRGQPYQVNTPKLKPMLPPKEGGQIQSIRSMDQDMRRNLGMMTESVQNQMNPLDPRAARGGIGSFILKVQSGFDPSAKEYIDFKSQTDQMFQEFRKDVTGAQAALKELGWLAPDFPEPNDPPETYYQKAVTALNKMQEGEKLLLDFYGQQGYRVGEMRKNSLNKPVPTFESLGGSDDVSSIDEELARINQQLGQ